MAIGSVTAIDAEQRALDRLLNERLQQDQARQAQQLADADAQSIRQTAILDQQQLDDLRDAKAAELLRQQRGLDARTLSQRDALQHLYDRLAEQSIRNGVVAGQQLIDERVRIDGQNAYRAQSQPPPPPSELADVLV